MVKTIYQHPGFWLFIFAVIFVLSLGGWRWHQGISPFILNFPSWIFYFMALQVGLTLAIWVFTQKFWLGSQQRKG